MGTSINIKIFKQPDILALEMLMKFGHVVGLCPSKVNIEKKIDYYIIFIAFLWLFGTIFLVTYGYIQKNCFTMEVTLTSFNLVFCGGLLFINLLNVMVQKNEWYKLIDTLIRADVTVALVGFKLKAFYIKLAVTYIIWILFEIHALFALKAQYKASSLAHNILTVVFLYRNYGLFWMMLIVKHLQLILETRYKVVETTLKQVEISSKDIKMIKEKLYNLYMCTKYINAIFGKPLLFLIMIMFSDSLYLFNDIMFFNADDEMDNFKLFLSASLCLKNGVLYITIIVIHCDKIEKVYKNILFACNTLTANVINDSCRHCLMDLMDFLKYMTPKFTAAGFFQLNQGVFSTFVSILASYFVVIVQFKTANGE